MPMLADCVIGADLANALRMLVDTMRLEVPGGDLTFRCPYCDKPVKPFVGNEHQPAHFEHLKRNEECPRSDVHR